jgi:hypothetical protein
MITCDAPTHSIELLLDQAGFTSELDFAACFADITSTEYTPGASDGTTNGTTAVTVMSAPSASTQRSLKFLSVYNAEGPCALRTRGDTCTREELATEAALGTEAADMADSAVAEWPPRTCRPWQTEGTSRSRFSRGCLRGV